MIRLYATLAAASIVFGVQGATADDLATLGVADGFGAADPERHGVYGALSRNLYPTIGGQGTTTNFYSIDLFIRELVYPALAEMPNAALRRDIANIALANANRDIQRMRAEMIARQSEMTTELRDGVRKDIVGTLCDRSVIDAASPVCQRFAESP
jgi:hypothetical protein